MIFSGLISAWYITKIITILYQILHCSEKTELNRITSLFNIMAIPACSLYCEHLAKCMIMFMRIHKVALLRGYFFVLGGGVPPKKE